MLHIRQYLPQDRDQVWELHNLALSLAGAHAGNEWYDDLHDIERFYLNNRGEFLVGLLDDRVVAMGALKLITREKAEVKRMRVHPDHQRKGYGRQILAALEERARELGYRTLVLDTAVIQTAAQQLYLNDGFRETGRAVFAGFDVILFEKELTS